MKQSGYYAEFKLLCMMRSSIKWNETTTVEKEIDRYDSGHVLVVINHRKKWVEKKIVREKAIHCTIFTLGD